MSWTGTNLRKWFEDKDAKVRYAPRHGGTYSSTDTLAVLYQRMNEKLQVRNEIQRIQDRYGPFGGFRTRLRDEIVAKTADERHAVLHAHVAEVEQAALESEGRNAELLKEIDARNQTAEDFQNANTDPTKPLHIIEATKRSKMLFIKVFGLPEEVLDPEKMADFRHMVSTGTSASKSSAFTTAVPKCREIINDRLGVPATHSGWSFDEVSNVIVQLGSANLQTDGYAEQIRTLQADVNRLEQEKLKAVDVAEQQSQHEEQRQNEADIHREAIEDMKRQLREQEEKLTVERRDAARMKHRLDGEVTKLRSEMELLKNERPVSSTNIADATRELEEKLEVAERELESTKFQLDLERENLAVVKEAAKSASAPSTSVNNALQVATKSLQEMRAEWVELFRGIINTYGTDDTIPEKTLRPILFVAQRGVGEAPLTSDAVDLRSSGRDQAVAVDKYHEMSVAHDHGFNVLRILQALIHPNAEVSAMVWFEQSIMPRVSKELGRSNGKASMYALMLYPALQEKLLTATGLSAAIAASALVELYSFFPFKEVTQWVGYLRSMISDGSVLETMPMIRQAGLARLVSTLAPDPRLVSTLTPDAGKEVINVVGDHPIGKLVLQGKIKPEHTIPRILRTLISFEPRLPSPEGNAHFMLEHGGRMLIVVNDGREECIFGWEKFAGWSCCTEKFAVFHDKEGIILKCRVSGDFSWRAPPLLDYVQYHPRYAKAVALASVNVTVERAESVYPALEAMLARMGDSMDTS